MMSMANAAQYRTWIELLSARAACQPERVVYSFLIDGASQRATLRFDELERSARAVAAALQDHGASGKPVLLMHPPGLEFVTAFFGCLLSGAIAVPTFPPRSPGHSRLVGRLRAIVRATRPVLAITDQATHCAVEGCLQAIVDDAGEPVRLLATDALEDSLAEQWRAPTVDAGSIACLQFSSGTSGTCKGIALSHENLLTNSEWIRQRFGHSHESVGVIWLPPYHDMGLLGGILQPLYANFLVVLMAPEMFLQRPLGWLEAVSRYRATTSGGPNFAYEWCVKRIARAEREGLDLRSWAVAFNGSEAVQSKTLERFATEFADCGFRREAFFPCYGLAEATLLVSGGPKTKPPTLLRLDRAALATGNVVPATGERHKTLVGCGVPGNHQTVQIVDPEWRTLCPPGTVGEIWLQSNCVAKGYWAGCASEPTPEESFEAVLEMPGGRETGFLRTGDLGFLHEGELFITGRLKDQIIIRGLNQDPWDIEQAAEASHPAVHGTDGAAFAIPGDSQEQVVVVHEINRTHRKTDLREAIAAIREAVAEQLDLSLAAVALIEPQHLPRTPNGKVQRAACRDAYRCGDLSTLAEWSQPSKPAVDVLTRGDGLMISAEEIKSWLLGEFAALVGRSPAEVDPTESFARYGLDSISAVSLGLEIEAKTGRRLPPSVFWDYPSVAELARFLTTRNSSSCHAE